MALQVQQTLSNTDIKALRATPFELVAAPGVGYVLEFMSAELFYDYGGTQYTETTDNLIIRYHNGSGQAVSEAIETTGFIDATGDIAIKAQPAAQATFLKAACDNLSIVLHNTGDGEFGGGHAASEIKVRVTYRKHLAGW